MKLAVDRRRLDLHAGAGLRPVARARAVPLDELVLHDIDAERREVVGGLARRMLDAPGLRRARSTLTGDLDRALDGADFVLIQIRVGGQAARLRDETFPLRLRLHRPGDHRRGRPRQGAAHGAGGARHRRAGARARGAATPGSSTSPTRSGSSPGRCSTPGTARSGCATWRSASSARSRALLGVEPDRVLVDQVGPQPPDLDPRASTLDGARRAAPSCSPSTCDALARRRPTCRAELLRELGACPRTTCATSTPTTRCWPSSGPARRARRRSPRSSASCSTCTATRRWPRSRRCSSGAAARSTARLPTQLVAVAGERRRRRPGRRRAQRRHAGRPRRRRRGRGARARRRATARRRCRRRRSRPSCSGSCSTWRRTSGWPPQAAVSGDRELAARRRCWRTRWSGQWPHVERLLDLLHRRAATGGAAVSIVLAVDGGDSKTAPRARRAPTARCSRSRAGPLSSPHQIGVDGCVELLERLAGEALERAGRAATAAPRRRRRT